MSIKSLVSILSDKTGRFKKVIKIRWLSVIVGILLTWAFLIIRVSLAENLVYISDDIYILGCEMFTESGPGPRLKEAAKYHKKNLEECKTHLRQRISESTPQKIVASAAKLPGASCIFAEWDEYSPEKGIDKALEILSSVEKETDQRKILEAIWEAGEHLLEFREEMISFRRVGRIEIGFYKSSRAHNDLRKAIKDAIDKSSEKLRQCNEGETSWQKVWDLCEANRKSVILLFLTRSRYNGDQILKYLKDFKLILKGSCELKKKYSETFAEDSAVRKLLALFAQSDERRLGIVEALQNNNIGEARYLMWQAKEDAKLNKSAALDILQAEEFKAAGDD